MGPITQRLLSLSSEARAKFLRSLSPQEVEAYYFSWREWARDGQLPPQEFLDHTKQIWLVRGGRGYGKTRTGVEWIRSQVEQEGVRRVGIIAPTAGDARDVIVEGESGILETAPPGYRPHYEPSKRKLTWSGGAIANIYSADEPDRLRGPQHEIVYCDELAQWRYPEAWDNMLFGLRLGTWPRVCVTTTAKRTKLYKQLLKDPTCIITGGSTYENLANLPASFVDQIVKRYEGTTLGRQELYSDLIEDVEGSLWKREQIERSRTSKLPGLVRVVVAIDPATTSGDDSDDTGIVVAGIDENGRGYVLEDATVKATPDGWARKAIELYKRHKADRVIGEANNGGDLIEFTLRTIDPNVSYYKVHASRGKITRAEPIAALYEQGKVSHLGNLAMLEDEMCTWTLGQSSPNRIDALVWALSDLMLNKGNEVIFQI